MTGQWRHVKNDSGAIYGEMLQLGSAWSKVSVVLFKCSDTANMNYSSSRGSISMQFKLSELPHIILLVS